MKSQLLLGGVTKSNVRLRRALLVDDEQAKRSTNVMTKEVLPYLANFRAKCPKTVRLRTLKPTNNSRETSFKEKWKASLLPKVKAVRHQRMTLKSRVESELKLDFLKSVATDKSQRAELSMINRSELNISRPVIKSRSNIPRDLSLPNSLLKAVPESPKTKYEASEEEKIQIQAITQKITDRYKVRLKRDWSLVEGENQSKMYKVKMNVIKNVTGMKTEPKNQVKAELKPSTAFDASQVAHDAANASVKNKRPMSPSEDDAHTEKYVMPRLSDNKVAVKKKLKDFMQNLIRWCRRADKMRLSIHDLIYHNIIPKHEYERPKSRQFFLAVGMKDVGLVAAFLKRDKKLLYQYDAMKRTALHRAVAREDLDMVKLLLSYFPDVEATDVFGDTPLSIALKKKNLEITRELIMAKADPIGGDLGDSQAHNLVTQELVNKAMGKKKRQ